MGDHLAAYTWRPPSVSFPVAPPSAVITGDSSPGAQRFGAFVIRVCWEKRFGDGRSREV